MVVTLVAIFTSLYLVLAFGDPFWKKTETDGLFANLTPLDQVHAFLAICAVLVGVAHLFVQNFVWLAGLTATYGFVLLNCNFWFPSLFDMSNQPALFLIICAALLLSMRGINIEE